jgi:hypothetical protein
MTIYVFGSRRFTQPSDIYSILFRETRFDEHLGNFNRLLTRFGNVSSMTNSITLYSTQAPMIQGSLVVTPTNDSATVSGITLSRDGYLLSVYAKTEIFGNSTTKSSLKNVDNYIGFDYTFFRAG